MTRQRRWQLRQKAIGHCIICGRPRGEDGTKQHCFRHAKMASVASGKYIIKRAKGRDGR